MYVYKPVYRRCFRVRLRLRLRGLRVRLGLRVGLRLWNVFFRILRLFLYGLRVFFLRVFRFRILLCFPDPVCVIYLLGDTRTNPSGISDVELPEELPEELLEELLKEGILKELPEELLDFLLE